MTTTFLREGMTSQTMLLITGQNAEQGAIINVYDSAKSYISLALDHTELLAFLRALPTALLLESLGERGFTEAIDLDDTPHPGDGESVPERFCPPVPPQASADTTTGGGYCVLTPEVQSLIAEVQHERIAASHVSSVDNPFFALDKPTTEREG